MQSRGFTLVELLVVVAIIALLLGILVPALSKARESGRRAVCGSNVRQVYIANTGYATENADYYVLAAEDIYSGSGGTKRWHGWRASDGVSADSDENHFDPALGPLASYLGEKGKVKACPTFRDAVLDGARNAFEEGTGGYGYNATYIGGRRDLFGLAPASASHSAKTSDVSIPAQTVMFADASIAQKDTVGAYVTEYSFAEPPRLELGGGRLAPARPAPSVHFRHDQTTTVNWSDGHVSFERLAITGASPYGVDADQMQTMQIGWFGPDDNALFDLE